MIIDSSVHTKTTSKPGWFELTKDFYFACPLIGPHTIPAGFTTDFASIPRIFRRIITVNGAHREEAVVHDWLYQLKGKLPNGQTITRKEADTIFYDFLRFDPLVSGWKAWAMYRAVRLGGWVYWRD